MILYLDTSALAKKYIGEAQSSDVIALLQGAELIGASLPPGWNCRRRWLKRCG